MCGERIRCPNIWCEYGTPLNALYIYVFVRGLMDD